MKRLQLGVAVATLACLSTQGAIAQDAGEGTQPPPAGAQSGSQLPEVQVIQKQKAKPKVKKAAQKPKKAAPQPQPIEPAAPLPAASDAALQAAASQGPVYANPAPPPGVLVAPLPGADLPIEKIPRSVNTLSSADIQRDHSVNMQDTLNNRIPGVVVDDLQGNAFQTGVQYRGFEASPVNGLPQGLAVYQNGVRINEAFGDTVNWDFIPANAIQDITVMSSNPIFGLNAIGGSISIAMKDGFSFQGADVDTRFGSFGRKQVSAEAGAQSGHWAVYGAFEAINDDGFRDFSDAQERRGYADIGVKGDGTELHFNTTVASSHVGVTAAVPEELIDFAGRSRTFTSPQITQSDMQMYSLNGSKQVTPDITVSGVTYYRHFQQSHIDGNISEFDECNKFGTGLCTEDGAPLFAFGSMAGIHDLDQYGDVLGSIDKTGQNTDGWGVALQAVDKADLFGHRNQFIIGTSYDRGHVAYQASSQLGGFLPRYVVAGTGPTLTGDASLCPPDEPTCEDNASEVTPRSLTTINDYAGVYALDAFDVTDRLTVTAGGRFNFARIQIINTGESSLDALNGVNEYNRFNPSAGFTYKVTPDMSFYGGYSEANRAPTASEIACSDPDNPCIIESALASDPHLDQVVTKTWELGLRGTQNYWNGSRIDWNVGWFRAINSDDIIQIADEQQGRGYFANAGDTLRQGIDASIQYRDQRLFAYASYSYVDATFLSSNVIPSENNPKVTTECSDFGIGGDDDDGGGDDDDDNCMQIRPGNRLPGIPRHRFKAGFDYKLTPKWIFGADLIAASNQIFFGDEANLDKPLQGYTKVNLHTSYNITDNVQVYGLIENLFDNQYGIYGTYFNRDLAQQAGPGCGGSNDAENCTGTGGGPDKSLNGLKYSDNDSRTSTPAIPFAAYGGIKVRF